MFWPSDLGAGTVFYPGFCLGKIPQPAPHPRAKHDTRFEWPVLILQPSHHYVWWCLGTKVQHLSATRRTIYMNWGFNSSPPSVAYMHQWIRSAMVQIMACCLFVTKPLPKPRPGYCPMEPSNFSEILIKIQNFPFTIMHLKISSAEWHVHGEMN